MIKEEEETREEKGNDVKACKEDYNKLERWLKMKKKDA